MRKRIWSETVPPETLTSRAVVAMLRRYSVDPIVAVQPGGQDGIGEALRRLRDEGLRPALWPMLDNTAGRWGSAWNIEPFVAWIRTASRSAVLDGNPSLEVVFDLEPPIALTSRWLGSQHHRVQGAVLRRARMAFVEQTLRAAVRELHDRGLQTMASVAPFVALDPPSSVVTAQGWQAWLGTPVDPIPWGSVNLMTYTSILRGWSKGALDRRAARSILRELSHRAALRYAGRSSISLGVIGPGALGDEPAYRGAFELAEDFSEALAGGVRDIAVYDLGGVLASPQPQKWFEAMQQPPSPSPRERSVRATVAFAAMRAVAWAGKAYGLGRARVL